MKNSAATNFNGLLDPIDGIENVLKEVVASPSLEKPRLLFLRMHTDEPQVDALAELLSDLLVDYALPLKKRQQANALAMGSNSRGSTVVHQRLRREALQLFLRFDEANKGRYGELGELLSYAIAVHYLRAVQVGSKMALKTSREMPIHGVDGLHLRPNDDGSVTFFLLESKITPSAADGSREMVDSVSEYRADRGRRLNELRLVQDLSNLDSLDGEQREVAKSFFNSYQGSGRHLKRRDVHLGSLVFSEEAYKDKLPVDHSKPITRHEEHLESLYMAKHARFKGNLDRQALAKSLDLGHCEVFLIAVPDVNELKRIFANLNQ